MAASAHAGLRLLRHILKDDNGTRKLHPLSIVNQFSRSAALRASGIIMHAIDLPNGPNKPFNFLPCQSGL